MTNSEQVAYQKMLRGIEEASYGGDIQDDDVSIRTVEAVELGEALGNKGNEEAAKAMDELLLALATGDEVLGESSLLVLQSFAQATHYELSGQKAHDEWVAKQEANEQYDSIMFDGGL